MGDRATGTELKEPATVVALDGQSVWVETRRQGTCNACSANKGCGQGVINRLLPGRVHYVRALRGSDSGRPLAVGDRVEVSVPEYMVLKSSFIVYLMPLLLMLAGALAGQALWSGDPGAVCGGLSGLLAGFALVRWHAVAQGDNASLQPRVQRPSEQWAEATVATVQDHLQTRG